jgi:hypothetical protein
LPLPLLFFLSFPQAGVPGERSWLAGVERICSSEITLKSDNRQPKQIVIIFLERTDVFTKMGRTVFSRIISSCSLALAGIALSASPAILQAQDNYEIQVYPSLTIPPKVLLTELHSNYTLEGSTTTQNGMLPTQGQEHETIELTEGIKDWAEVGFSNFT